MPNLSDHKQRRQEKWRVWFFPTLPSRLLTNIRLMTTLAALFALRIILSYISIPIPIVVLNFSFVYVPTMVIGWFYGPIIGFAGGAICDTLGFLLYPSGIWFWMYAIQEPLTGLLSGIIANVCRWRISLPKQKTWQDLFVFEVVFCLFLSISLYVLIKWLPQAEKFESEGYLYFRYISCGLLAAFSVGIQSFVLFLFFKQKQKKETCTTFLYAFMIVLLTTLVWSFIFGPSITIAYLRYIGTPISNWTKYGAIYYLIPRIIVQGIKTPIEVVIFSSLIVMLNPLFNNQRKIINKSWT